jgi:hypothetical protein
MTPEQTHQDNVTLVVFICLIIGCWVIGCFLMGALFYLMEM